ncbi:hypothetical protein F53441_11274 [Fusarium austroafricanum]|uniref:Uncharacterized protein n=1 Tax=Fusarium austroafricanum TaxID=2364996 RepID=A0A8H4K7N1_9HYPO|nr:hypothetical protein F53441_11274 [Fusarium austroafricanum]
MSSTMLSKLREFLEPFLQLQRVGGKGANESTPSARFGHIQMSPYRLGKVSLMESVRKITADIIEADVIFVVTNLERDIGTGLSQQDNVKTLTFSGLLDSLEVTKLAATSGNKWSCSIDDAPWEEGQALPPFVVLVLCLDLEMSADCAQSLRGVVKWALQVSIDPSSYIRVLTMSVEKDFLSEVVSFTVPGFGVANLDLAAHGEQDPAQQCYVSGASSTDGYAAEIVQSIRANKTSRRLIVSFNGQLEYKLKSIMSGDEWKLVKCLPVDASRNVKPLLELQTPNEGPEQGPITLLLSFRGEIPLLPLDIHGFDELHVAMGSTGAMKLGWDGSQTSCRQWIRQPAIKTRCLYPGAATIQLFLGGGRPRPLLIEHSQLGGFIAALVNLRPWGIDVDNVLECFIRDPLAVEDMWGRLQIQDLITYDGRLALSGEEATIFRVVLPMLGYNYRLAQLVALDSKPNVRRVKVQLAVLLKHGLSNVIRFDASVYKDPKLYNKLVQECHGLGHSLACQGNMWLALGLFKRHQMIAERSDGYKRSTDSHKGLAVVNSSHARSLGTEISEMLLGLTQIGVNVDESISVSHETDELRSEEQAQLQSHLLQAYLDHLTVVYNNEQTGNQHKFVSSMRDTSRKGPAMLIDVKPLPEESFVYGISHNLRRIGNDAFPSLMDWTRIPGVVVATWRYSKMPGINLYDKIRTNIWYPLEE